MERLTKERYATIDSDGSWAEPTPRDEVRRVMTRGRKVYFRFGRPRGASYNYRDRRLERGLSVWSGYILASTCVVDLRGVDGLSAVLIIGSRASDVYVVTGAEIGLGSDGEPLLDPEAYRAKKVKVDKIVLLLSDASSAEQTEGGKG